MIDVEFAYNAWTHIYQNVLTSKQKDTAYDHIQILETYLEEQLPPIEEVFNTK
jgi:hypothetical protein